MACVADGSAYRTLRSGRRLVVTDSPPRRTRSRSRDSAAGSAASGDDGKPSALREYTAEVRASQDALRRVHDSALAQASLSTENLAMSRTGVAAKEPLEELASVDEPLARNTDRGCLQERFIQESAVPLECAKPQPSHAESLLSPEPRKSLDAAMTLWPQGAGAVMGEASRSRRSSQKLLLSPMSCEPLGFRRRSASPATEPARDSFQGDFLGDLMNAPASITRVQRRLESPAREDAPESSPFPPPTAESSRHLPQQAVLARRRSTLVQGEQHVSQPKTKAVPQPIPRRRILKKMSELNLMRRWLTTSTRRRFRCKKPDTTRAFGPIIKKVAKSRTCIRGADGRAVQINVGNKTCLSAADFCMARVWNSGFGGQCTRVRVGSDFCKFHATKWRVHGRIDGPIPEAKAIEFARFAKQLEMKRKHVDVTAVSATQ